MVPNIWFNIRSSVSYTHLDVYKRQELNRGALEVPPVSYTHLISFSNFEGGKCECDYEMLMCVDELEREWKESYIMRDLNIQFLFDNRS